MKLADLHKEFFWARSLTFDLLKASSDTTLSFQLNTASGPLWKQFRHIGRVHENYLQALQSGRVQFETHNCTYKDGLSKTALISYFQRLEESHHAEFSRLEESRKIDWFGTPKSLEQHILALLEHETLHHGQLILYWKTIGCEFPDSWSDWGE